MLHLGDHFVGLADVEVGEVPEVAEHQVDGARTLEGVWPGNAAIARNGLGHQAGVEMRAIVGDRVSVARPPGRPVCVQAGAFGVMNSNRSAIAASSSLAPTGSLSRPTRTC